MGWFSVTSVMLLNFTPPARSFRMAYWNSGRFVSKELMSRRPPSHGEMRLNVKAPVLEVPSLRGLRERVSLLSPKNLGQYVPVSR